MKTLNLFFLSLILGASFQNIGQIDHWETAVFEDDAWSYLVPSSPVPSDWKLLSFDASSWSTGPGGFGYGDGDDNTITAGGISSVFQRIEFTITDTNTIDGAALTIDYDDGFVAYLNGVEISRDLMSGTDPDWDQYTTGLHEAQIYAGSYPAQYSISKAFLSANLNQGNNVLSVQTHNESATSSDLSSRVFFHLGINNGSSDYSPAPGWFVPPFIFTGGNLPIVVINTVDGVGIPNEPKVTAEMGIINNDSGINSINDPFNEFFGNIGIEIRGSSSGGFDKKSYGLETRGPDSSNYNVSIFDWPSDNDWILYAPYSDKSLIRNVLTYKIGEELGMWTPRTKMVEVVLNGSYEGVYVFMEKIKQGPGRVNVDELTYDDTLNNPLTGGYIIKVDKTTSGGIIAWTSPFTAAAPATGPVRYQLHDPDISEIHPLQLNYIQQYVTDFETALDGPDYADPIIGYEKYIDVNSFIDFMIVNEISKNVDGYRISTFLHKQADSKGGKLFAGPLWDFNLAWGNANYCEGGLTSGWEIYFNDVCGGGGSLNNPFWWNRLVTDPDFTHALHCRWLELRSDILKTSTIIAYIEEMEVYLADAADRNFQRWPVLGTYLWPNNFVGATYDEEMDYLKSWTTSRLDWMDANMFGSCTDLGIENNSNQMTVYPNPSAGLTFIALHKNIADGKIVLTDIYGKVILNQDFVGSTIKLDLENQSNGLYFIQLYSGNEFISTEKLIYQKSN